MITGDEPATGFGIPESKRYDGESYTGLTIRQHFAAMFMQGLLSNSSATIVTTINIAEKAVLLADSLITELNKTNP